MSGLASLIARSLSKEASKAVTKQAPEAAKVAPRQLEMPLGVPQTEQRLLKDQYQESLDKLGDATSIAPTPPRMFGDPKYSFLNPILEQTGRKTEDIIAEGVGEYSDVAGKRFITNKRVSNSQINPYNGPGPKFKGTLSEDDITEEQVKNLAKELRSEDVGLLKTNLLKKDKFTVVDDRTGGQLESIGKEGDSYGIVTVAVSGVKNAPQYKKNRGMESDHIYGLHLNIEGDAALLTHKVKDARASAKKGKTVYQQPSLKPTMVGDMRGRNVIGTIKVAGRKEHPLYDVIDIDAATFSDYGFNAGGLLNNNLVEFDASIFEEDTINMNAGGLSMDKQMELFEDGGNVDPVSGNDIPLGSTAAEVRDDQPAMLSEGEMVIPADVVRYFGVEYFMTLRDKAKMGYKKMEAMGQFGTEEGQTLPDDTIFNAGGPPFTIEDIEVIEDYEEGESEEKEPIKAADGALIDENATVTDDQLTNTGSGIAFNFKDVEDLIGTNSFEYLKRFLPQNVVDSSSDADQQAFQNYGANLAANLSAATGAGATGTTAGTTSGDTTGGGEDPVGTGGITAGGPSGNFNTPGTGSVAELAAYPSDANIQGLKSFASLADSYAGRAMLSLMGQVVANAINPPTKITSAAQNIAGFMERNLKGTNTIAESLNSLSSIPMVQANAANRAAISYENSFKDLSPQERSNINTMATLKQAGDVLGQDILGDPSITKGTLSNGQVGFKGTGAFAATYGVNPVTGQVEIVGGEKFTKTLDEDDIKNGNKSLNTAISNANEAMSLSPSLTPEQQQALGAGLTGPETFASLSETPTNLQGFQYSPEDLPDVNRDITPDYGGMTGAGAAGAGGSSTGSALEGYSDTGGFDEGTTGFSSGSDLEGYSDTGGFDEGGGDDGGAGGGGGGGDAASDTGADGPDGGAGGPGDFKRGGFVHKRKNKKKKKRRGLAGR